jgi:O-antigen/teichoic acid export membrane protein
VGRQSGAYLIGALVGPGPSLLLLPIYTRFLSPAEYGVIALLEIVSVVLTSVFSLGMPSILQFYYSEPLELHRRRQLVGTLLAGVTAVNLFLVVVTLGIAPALLPILLPSVPFTPYVSIVVITVFIEPYWTIFGSVLQMQERAAAYAAWAASRNLLSMVARVTFVAVLGQS